MIGDTHGTNLTIIYLTCIGNVMNYSLINKIEDIADWASQKSGTSYEDYIRLFSFRVDKAYKKHRMYNTAIYIAVQYGYVPKKERKIEFAQ